MAQASSCEFCEISKDTFFTEHLRATASFLSDFISVCYLEAPLIDKIHCERYRNFTRFPGVEIMTS